jgi:hypothetical protein
METFEMKFKVGDVVKITRELYGHEFTIGDLVTIEEVNEGDGDYEAIAEDGECWSVREDEIELQ